MKRLWVQQTVAFSVVVIVTMGAVVFWISQGVDKEFRKYITSSEVRWSDEGSYELVEHYQRQGSWEGVESLLGEGVYYSYERRSMVLIATFPDPERLALALKEEAQPDVILADANGRIVFDSTGKGYGKLLSRNERGNAWPIRRLNAPLQRLADAARAVAEGDLEQQVRAGGSMEVAQVGQAFNEMTAALQEAETLRQNMVADVAHELRTPISVLQGNLLF